MHSASTAKMIAASTQAQLLAGLAQLPRGNGSAWGQSGDLLDRVRGGERGYDAA